jgi:predicted unusual protein kinase regulating ubiquinone biosynthesis (AarF/ABC1/UbiB family)
MELIHFGLKRFAKGQNVKHLVREIEDRLYEEVEYILEAENYQFFSEHIKMEQIIVPKVYPDLSTNRVLTTQMLEGVGLDNFLSTNPSQESINTYAQLIFDSFFHTLYTLGRIHADPNPGNFLFMDEGKLGLIDFGCVKSVSRDFLSQYTALHMSLLKGARDEEIIPHYVGFGMIKEDTPENMLHFYREVIKPLDRLYIEPLIDESYDFKLNSDFSKKGFEAIFEVHAKQYHSVHQVNEEYIFLDRTLLGYYAMFEKMGAKIDTAMMKRLINQFQGEDND